MVGACGDGAKTIKTIFVAKNSNSSARKCFQANDSELRGYFTRATLQDGNLSLKPHIEGELLTLNQQGVPKILQLCVGEVRR